MSPCPICCRSTPAGHETNFICDDCVITHKVSFALRKEVTGSADASIVAAAESGMRAVGLVHLAYAKTARRARMEHAWQAMQCWLMLCCIDSSSAASQGVAHIVKRGLYSATPVLMRLALFRRH